MLNSAPWIWAEEPLATCELDGTDITLRILKPYFKTAADADVYDSCQTRFTRSIPPWWSVSDYRSTKH